MSNRGFKKGDRVKVVREGGINGEGIGPYSQGTEGTIDRFRNNRFWGRQAEVVLDDEPDTVVDWTLTDIEKVP